jgi:hypothetical protein
LIYISDLPIATVTLHVKKRQLNVLGARAKTSRLFSLKIPNDKQIFSEAKCSIKIVKISLNSSVL